MKLSTIFEMDGEFIPFDNTKKSAYSVGSQIARVALSKTGGHRARARKLATTLVNRFISDMEVAMNDELGMKEHPHLDLSA